MFQRHHLQTDAILFITTNTNARRKIFQKPAFAHEAIETLYRVQELHPFFLYGFVIMPDHCHFLLRPVPPSRISTIVRVFKCGVAFNIGMGPIWQSRFHVKEVEDVIAFRQYIFSNPVKAGIAKIPQEYPWSSANGRWEVTDWGCL